MLEPVPEMADQADSRTAVPNRVELVAYNAANGIWDLCDGISKADDTYIAVVGFGEDAEILPLPNGNRFIVSATSLREYFDNAQSLEEFLMRSFDDLIEKLGTGTNISSGLALAKALYDGLLASDLREFGGPADVRPIEHSVVRPDHSEVVMPNFRAFIFSDGKHNRGALINGFAEGEESQDPWATLMTAFIGAHNDAAVPQMKSLAGTCPYHTRKNFFLINDKDRFQQLRGLFKMASGASGFCPVCLGEY